MSPFPQLVAALAAAGDVDQHSCDGWSARRVRGGTNGRVFRAASSERQVAVKFSVADERNRAQRERLALDALAAAGLDIAPRCLHAEPDRRPYPAVVTEWLDGEVSAEPPESDAEWLALVDHARSIHSVTPEAAPLPLPPGTSTTAAALLEVRRNLEPVPESARPPEVCALLDKLFQLPFPDDRTNRLTLCRRDWNLRNFIRRPGTWASVDWEVACWADPAYDLTELVTHASLETQPDERRAWLVDAYCRPEADPTFRERFERYHVIWICWWTVLLLRLAYQQSTGTGAARLGPSIAVDELVARYRRYLARAQATLTAVTAILP